MLALSAIAFSIIISHVIIDYQISNQKKDSYLINISGRQRMLSQKLSKETFLFKDEEDLVQRNFYVTSLKQTLDLWSESHQILTANENSGVVKQLFTLLDPYYQAMQKSAYQLISAVERNPNISTDLLSTHISTIKSNESHFLILMDRIVKQYEVEATEKVDQLRYIEFIIFAITIIILLLEFFFVFKPAASTVEEVILKLLVAEKKAVKMAYDADLLCDAKDKSVKELRTLNYAMDQTLLFCRISTTGEVIHMGDKFSNLLQVNAFAVNTKFSHLLTNSNEERKTIDNLIIEKNIPELLVAYNDILAKGFDGHHFIAGLASHFRDLLVCKNPATLTLLEAGEQAQQLYYTQSQKTSQQFLLEAIELANACDFKYKNSQNQRLLVELCLMQLASILFDGEKKKLSHS